MYLDNITHSNHIQVVYLSPPEKAIYQESMQRVAEVDFDVCEIKTNRILESQIRGRLAKDCEDGVEALILRAACFSEEDSIDEIPKQYTSKPEPGRPEIVDLEMTGKSVALTALNPPTRNTQQQTDSVIAIRETWYQELSHSFQQHLKHAEWLNNDPECNCKFYEDFKMRTRKCAPEDVEAMEEIRAMMSAAEDAYSVDDWKDFYRTGNTENEDMRLPTLPKGKSTKHGLRHLPQSVVNLRHICAILNDLQEELVIQKRAIRHFKSVLSIQSLPSQDEGRQLESNIRCHKCCDQLTAPENMILLTTCGHLVCPSHFTALLQSQCPVDGCTALYEEHTKYTVTEMNASWAANTLSVHGAKLDGIIELIHRIPKDDRVLLFLQFRTLTQKVKQLLAAAGIKICDLTGTEYRDRSKLLSQFQDGIDTSKVLVMNIGDTSAAGR